MQKYKVAVLTEILVNADTYDEAQAIAQKALDTPDELKKIAKALKVGFAERLEGLDLTDEA